MYVRMYVRTYVCTHLWLEGGAEEIRVGIRMRVCDSILKARVARTWFVILQVKT